jgi:hypothetical protein
MGMGMPSYAFSVPSYAVSVFTGRKCFACRVHLQNAGLAYEEGGINCEDCQWSLTSPALSFSMSVFVAVML